jgi:exonuclease SbcC
MRILAIRGENLASLRTFEVDLAEGALSHVGLFAITGPTGSGKSTLLDALCLALYDRTPRLGAAMRNVASIGAVDDAHRIKANDVRGILRRGAGTGYAEVDFEGVDAVRYRARWSIHRARKRPGGKLQNQSVTFETLDGEVLTAHRKTDTLSLIEARVGLTFGQFRRSVLLAQGEFDAFLKADVKNRSELLERMTGTEIYGDLSRAAHARAAEARLALDRIEQRLEAHEVLSEAGRDVLAREIVAARAWVEAAQGRVTLLEGRLRWREQYEAVQLMQTRAAEAVQGARTQWTEAQPRRTALAEARAAEPLRPVLARWSAATDRATQASAQHSARAADVAGAEQARSERADGLEQAAVLRDEARAAREALAPQLVHARQLDRNAERTERALNDTSARAKTRGAEASEAAQTLAQATAAVADQRAQVAAARAWLAAHSGEQILAEQWPRWSREFDTWLQALARDRAGAAGLVTLEATAAGANEAFAQAQRTHQQAQVEVEQSQAQLDRLTAESSAHPSDYGVRISAVDGRLQQWRQLRDLVDRARALHLELVEATERRDEARKVARRARREADKRAQHQASLAEALVEAEAGLERVQRIAGLVTLRAELVDGTPCPLCGSETHPGGAEGVEAVVHEQAQAVALLKSQERAAFAAQNKTVEAVAGAKQRQADAEVLLVSRTRALGSVRTDWELVRMGVSAELPQDVLTEGTEQQISRAVDAAHDDREALEAAMKQALAQVARREAARQAYDGAVAQVRASATVLSDTREVAYYAAQARDVAQRDQADAALERGEAAQRLAEPLGAPDGWLAGAEQSPEAFQAATAQRAAAWRAKADEALDAEHAVSRGQPQVDRADERVHHCRRAAKEAQAALGAAQAERDAVLGERSALFEGRPVDLVEAEARGAAEAAELGYETARTARDQARQALATAQGRLHNATDDQRGAQAAAEVAEQRLADALDQAGFTLEVLQQRLQRDPAALEAEHAALEALNQQVDRAETLQKQRESDRVALEAGQPEGALAEDLDEVLGDARADVDEFREAQTMILARHKADRSARTAREALGPALEAERSAARTWQQLDTLIGAADGAKFRQFAQSLTLEAVVAQANNHLEALSPRYLLMRVPGEDLALQVVDRDMADEIRAVLSLSGGESFLVSLALALGLASLSSRDTRIESLFIDEGLGSLDVDTLEKVLDTLDALQATGRQVGLISHVPGLADRIGAQVAIIPESAGISRLEVRGVQHAA